MVCKKVIDCFWFTNIHYKQCMGIIKIYDTKTKKYTYYVGFGDGENEEDDIQEIVEWGTKYEEEQFKDMYGNLIKKKFQNGW